MNRVTLSPVSNRENYSESFEALDDADTPIDLTDATIVCEMRQKCGPATALTVEVSDETFTISLTDTQTRALNVGEYDIGCTIEIDDFVTQFFIGTIQVLDGVVS